MGISVFPISTVSQCFKFQQWDKGQEGKDFYSASSKETDLFTFQGLDLRIKGVLCKQQSTQDPAVCCRAADISFSFIPYHKMTTYNVG